MRKNPAFTVALMGICTALALAFSYLETFIPMMPMFPGAKIGFSNIVVLWAMYVLSPWSALTVGVLKTVLSGLLFSGPISILYGLNGVILSFLGMWLLKKLNVFSPIGVSAVGGVLHNIGQLIVAGLILQTTAVIYYLPYMLLCGVIFGILVGIIGKLCIVKTPKNLKMPKGDKT